MRYVKNRGRSLSRFLVLLAIAVSQVGCQEEVTPPGCHLSEGLVRVQMAEGVRADSALRALSVIGLPFDTTEVVDCFSVYFEVTSGEPIEKLRALRAATDPGVIGVWHDNQVFAAFCDRDSSWVIQQGSSVPGLRYDHTRWHDLETTVVVPYGQEDEWVASLEGLAFVGHAERPIWCPM